MNIVEPIFAQAKNKPSELALCAPGTGFNLVSYARLQRIVNNICYRIISAGIAPRSRIAVVIEDPIFHAMVLIALGRLGVVTISGSRKNASWPIRIDGVIVDRSNESAAGNSFLADPSWADGDGREVAEKHLYRAAPDEVCRIFLTSGANGRDKAISMTHRMMATRIDRHKLFVGPRVPFCDRTYLDLPLTTPLGFQVLLAMLWRGGALLMPCGGENTLGALSTYKIENIIGSPDNLLKLAGMIETGPGHSTALQAVFSAESNISQATSDRIRARLCSNLATGYMSEDGTMVASMPAHVASGIAGAVGYILPGVLVEIVADDERALPLEKEGKLRIRSDHGATEYVEDPGETQRAFRNGWFYPGDRGYLTTDNMLVISSRAGSA